MLQIQILKAGTWSILPSKSGNLRVYKTKLWSKCLADDQIWFCYCLCQLQ